MKPRPDLLQSPRAFLNAQVGSLDRLKAKYYKGQAQQFWTHSSSTEGGSITYRLKSGHYRIYLLGISYTSSGSNFVFIFKTTCMDRRSALRDTSPFRITVSAAWLWLSREEFGQHGMTYPKRKRSTLNVRYLVKLFHILLYKEVPPCLQ